MNETAGETIRPLRGDGGGGAPVQLDKSAATIQEMFSEVAPRYDLLNRLLSARMDVKWRRRAAAALRLAPNARVLDLCSGTGDQSVAIRNRHDARVAAGDFCVPMLALAREKFADFDRPRPANLASDALDLPFAEGSFDAATVSFGLRNVADLGLALSEIRRVLKVRGELVVLEFALPRSRILNAAYRSYFERILPAIGRLVSQRGSAYQYLPESVGRFPQREKFLAAMATAGFDEVSWQDLSFGVVCLYRGRRKAANGEPPSGRP